MHVVIEFLENNWEPLATVVTLIVVLATYWKSRAMWKARDFMTRVNFSLNYVEGNTLKIRTLRESDIRHVLLGNQHGRKLVLRCARRTSRAKPFLQLPKRDAWIVLNSILNEISEQFAEGFLAASMGAPVQSATYVFGITCERDSNVRMNKIRVMIIEKSLLEKIDTLGELRFEQKHHHVRQATLKRMREIYGSTERGRSLLELELPIHPGYARSELPAGS